MDTETEPIFPSLGHRKALLQQSTKSMPGGVIGYDFGKLSDPDHWSIHAYDYAFRRIYLDDFTGKSPIDPKGLWYDPRLAAEAERCYRP